MQAYPWNPERDHALKQRLIELGYQDGVHPYQIIKNDMDELLSRLTADLRNLANKRHDLPYYGPDLLIQLKDREALRQAMEDYVQEYLNEAIPGYSSEAGLERAREHEERVGKQIASMHEREGTTPKPKVKPKRESLADSIAGLSPDEKATLLKSMLK